MAATGALAGFLMWPEPGARAAGPTSVEVAGHQIHLNGDVHRLARLVAHRYLATPVRLRGREVELSTSRAALGIRVDVAHLAALLTHAANPRSVMRRVHGHLREGQPLRLPIPAAVDTERALPWLKRLKDAVDRAPVDARIDPRKGEIVPAQSGRGLDLFASLEALDDAARSGARVLEAVVHTRAPTRNVSAYERIDMSAVLARFETSYSRLQKARDRTHNLQVAASKVDGLVIRPDEVFDFNATVGDRTRSNGFRMAPVIAYGKLVDGMGGGTCQIASTLHSAVLFAGLPVLARSPHSRPSFYIKLGLDAAVAYGTLNFRFRNDLPYPVVLGMTVAAGKVSAAVYGARQDREVTFMRRVEQAIPFSEKTIEDEGLPSGLRVLTQRGIPGFRLTRFRVVRDLGTGQATRERDTDSYPPTTQIWRVGTGPEAKEDYQPPDNDSHPEYVADEYLRAVQRPGRPGLDVSRKPGRYGTYGWTKRMWPTPPRAE
ncbi:MAG: VanW family protein [Myxococcales bacterium]|nr:VanW family protein [Myxococcales bacterium]